MSEVAAPACVHAVTIDTKVQWGDGFVNVSVHLANVLSAD